MPTPTKGRRLGGSPTHQRLMLANLATALFEHGRLTTTEAKARRLRPVAERLITFAKRGDLHARRHVLTVVRDKGVVHTLFTEIGPRFAARQGGYTRITKIGPRKGDNAPMVVIELVEAQTVAQQAVSEGERARRTRFVRGSRNDTRSAAADQQEGVAAGGSTVAVASDEPQELQTAEDEIVVANDTSSEPVSGDTLGADGPVVTTNETVEPVETGPPLEPMSPDEVAAANASSVQSAGSPADDAAIAAAPDGAMPTQTEDDAAPAGDETGR